jgi:hypothetical protein
MAASRQSRAMGVARSRRPSLVVRALTVAHPTGKVNGPFARLWVRTA